jgi:clan AA aspartic protease (TIGR02281 family)
VRSLSDVLRRLAVLLVILTATMGATVADLNEAGKAAYVRGDYAEAERLFGVAAKQSPGDPILHYHRAAALTRLGRWTEAAEAYSTMLRLDPSSAIAGAARESLRARAPLARPPARRPDDASPPPPPRRPRPPDETQIPLTRLGGNWIVDVLLNDQRGARFLVDTGASVSVISPELAEALGIAPDGGNAPVPLQTLSGMTQGHPVTLSSIRVGEVEARDVRAVVHATGPEMDGILGNTFLGRFVVRLDPERGTLELRPR